MRGKIGMETNKALVLNERGHHFFSFLFAQNKFASSRNKSIVTVLDSSLLVMSSLCAFYPQDEDWWPTLQSGQKEWQRKRFVENERQTLLGLRLAAHTKKILQNLPKKLASNDAEDLLCSLFLYFLSFFFLLCVYVYVVCIFKNITFFNCCSSP